MIARHDTGGAELQAVDREANEAMAYYADRFAPIVRLAAIAVALGAGYLAGMLIGGAQ